MPSSVPSPASYRCSRCSASSARKLGVCPTCRAAGTMRPSLDEPRRRKLIARPRPWGGLFRGPRGRSGDFLDPYWRGSGVRPPVVLDGDLDLDDESDDPDLPLPDDALRVGVNDSLDLPVEFATQSAALLAKKGVGKTYCLRVLAEEFDRLGVPCCAIDPMGAMWGLSRNADDTDVGLSCLLYGGDRGQPLPSGVSAAEVAASSDELTVFDLSHLMIDEMTAWGADFFETIYAVKGRDRSPLHLLVDEADVFAPQSSGDDTVQRRARLALEYVVRRGRIFGLGETLATQRPSVLHKNVLSQTQVLFAMRLPSPQDREAVDEWVKACGDDYEKRDALLDSVASLEVGEAWVWSPGWQGIFRRVRVRRCRTYDSSATPAVEVRPRGA